MKTLKSMLAVIALLFVGAAANAKTGGNATKEDAINTYITAISTGNTGDLSTELENDMQFNIHRGDNVTSLNKDELVNNIKQVGASQPLSTNTSVLEDDPYSAQVKVEFKYDGYTRTDVVTLDKTTGWMITKVDRTTL
jgi:hypothetical protein